MGRDFMKENDWSIIDWKSKNQFLFFGVWNFANVSSLDESSKSKCGLP